MTTILIVDEDTGIRTLVADYLTKPFSTRELLARIRGVLRRSPDRLPVHRYRRDEGHAFFGWCLRVNTRELFDPAGVLVTLTGGSFDLLLALVRKLGRVSSRGQLLELTRGRRAEPFDRSIDVQLSRLRRQLGDSENIKMVRGVAPTTRLKQTKNRSRIDTRLAAPPSAAQTPGWRRMPDRRRD